MDYAKLMAAEHVASTLDVINQVKAAVSVVHMEAGSVVEY